MRLLAALLLGCVAAAAKPAAIFYERDNAPAAFGASEIRAALIEGAQPLVELGLDAVNASTAPLRFVIASSPADSRRIADQLGVRWSPPSAAQSYSIRRSDVNGRTTLAVLGSDPAGAMYGALDLAEAIRFGTVASLADSDHSPRIERRGIKFNVPLDVRTPSYSDNSDAAQYNIPEMWSFDFWREFIDNMARHRYNVLSLWNLHPFPSLVKVPEFPDVALDDVKRTLIPMDDTYSHSGDDMLRPVLLTKTETVKRMSVAEKIGFWRAVMQYAHDRGIEVYWITWNIFTFGAEGKYGITSDQTNQKTIDYFRASVREMVLTYPLLDGIGITAGEHMQDRKDGFGKEAWLWKTYGEGIRDALELQPGRRFRLIHRYHQTAQTDILDAFKDYPGQFDLSFKYAIAHMYSVPNPPFIKDALPYITPEHRTWLTVRDDDVYSFRWGDPEFARAFVRNMPPKEKMVGFYMGPDGTIWGREVIAKTPQMPRELVIAKRWYSFMLWGRLAYDPDLPDSVFQNAIAVRFPEVDAAKLMRTQAEASKILPQITRFFWGDIDLRWFPEACLSHPRHKGFYTVQHFIQGETMPGSGVLDIVTWRQRKLAGEPMNGVTPIEVADALAGHAAATLKSVAELRQASRPGKELQSTLLDLEAMAHLGNYYAAKIRGAAELALFDKTSKPENREIAVRYLFQALDHWKRYAGAYTAQYKPVQLYNRVGYVDIPGLTRNVEQDIAIARLWAPGTVPDGGSKRQADTPFRR